MNSCHAVPKRAVCWVTATPRHPSPHPRQPCRRGGGAGWSGCLVGRGGGGERAAASDGGQFSCNMVLIRRARPSISLSEVTVSSSSSSERSNSSCVSARSAESGLAMSCRNLRNRASISSLTQPPIDKGHAGGGPSDRERTPTDRPRYWHRRSLQWTAELPHCRRRAARATPRHHTVAPRAESV